MNHRLKLKKQILFVIFFSLFFYRFASADNCFVDCMRAAGCWDSRSDENVSFCSGTNARCSSECRNSGNSSGNSHKSYGAIAYSKKDGGYGYSDGKINRGQAEKTALKYCKQYGKKCKVAVWFYNQCGAVAVDGRKIGVGLGDSNLAANEDALKECRKSGKKNCEVKVSHCSF